MRILNDITDFIFVRDEPGHADVIFLPGGSYPEPSERAAALWREGYAPLLIPSGRYDVKLGRFPGSKSKTERYGGPYETEAAFMTDVLMQSGVPESAIVPEERAGDRGTLDNASFSRELTDALGLTIGRAILCCKSFHARRCLLSYAWAYPRTRFFVCPVDLPGRGRDDWFRCELGVRTVMGEMEKCGRYFADKMQGFIGGDGECPPNGDMPL